MHSVCMCLYEMHLHWSNNALAKRKEELKSGKVKMSGREMFSVNPTLFVDDDSAMDNVELEEKKDLDEVDEHLYGL